MTVSIRQTLARRPGGKLDSAVVSWGDVGTYLMRHYLDNDDEKKRKLKAAERQRLYQSGGDADMLTMLQKVFTTNEVVELRRQWIGFAKYNNVLRRVCHELATVYSLPAIRKVGGNEKNKANYKTVQQMCRQDEVMQRINPLIFLHRALAVGPRMRETPSNEWEPVIDVVTPACFSAVRDPLDPSQLIALIFENDYALPTMAKAAPRWTVWTWNETFMVSSYGEVLEGTVIEHGYGGIPWVLMTLDPPDGKLIDSDTGEDLVAAQKAIWFLNILHLKESKSATKQTLVSGDTTTATRNQVNDTDMTGVLPDGVSLTTVDRSMDVTMFPKGATHIGDTTASNYGLAPSILHGDTPQSGDARELARIPLRELRLRQHIPFRQFERHLADLLSKVVTERRDDLAFTTDEWSIEFADPQTPLGTKEALDVFQLERQLTLTSTKREVKKRNPDLDDQQAETFINENISDELKRNQEMKQLQQISGSTGALMPLGLATQAANTTPQKIMVDRAAEPLQAVV